MSQPDPRQPLTLRDRLALDRTELALERTGLAVVRTSLGLLAAGGTIIQLGTFPGAPLVGGAFVALAVVVLLWGTRRVTRTWRALQRDRQG